LRHIVLTLVIVSSVVGATFILSRWYFSSTDGYHLSKKAQCIPSGIKARTQKEFYAEMHVWLLRHTVEAYKKNIRPKDQDTAIIAFLKKLSHAEAFPAELRDYRVLVKEGANLIDAGCNDPLVRLWYGQMLFHCKELEKAESQLMVAYEWDSNKYPDINAFFAFRSLAFIAQRKRANRPGETRNHISFALDRFCRSVVNNEFSDSEVHIAYRLLDETHSDGLDMPKYTIIFNALGSHDGINQWLMNLIRANNEIDLAWEARGTGWAKDVTAESWEQYGKHLDQARLLLTATWQSDPNRPEAAGDMMTVTRGSHGNEGETVRTWFDRAVSAQMDYPEAYKEMVLALRPRWGGSHGQMLEFGRECLATKRFDTDVPLFYLYALRQIGAEMKHYRWRLPFRDGRTQKDLLGLFEGLLAEPARTQAYNRIQTQQALVKAWSGDYSGAKKLLESTDNIVDLGDGFLGKALSWSNRSRGSIESELRAFTGPNRDILVKAEDLELRNRIPEALELYEKAMREHRNDAGIFSYLRDRMARLKLGKTAEDSADPPLVLAAENNALEIAAFMLDNDADSDCEDFYFWTPLHHAAANNYTRMAELLLQHRAGLEKRAFGLVTPLHLAIKDNHPDMARLLLEHGADVNARDSGGWMALHFALYYEHPEMAAMCIQKGADLHAKSEGGWSPLHHATKHGLADNARMLIAKGAPLEDRTDFGWTPLQIAVWEGNDSMVRLLIAEGADVTAALPDGRTPLMIARERQLPAIEKLLHPN
jgi:ankyrin repeat protein